MIGEGSGMFSLAWSDDYTGDVNEPYVHMTVKLGPTWVQKQ